MPVSTNGASPAPGAGGSGANAPGAAGVELVFNCFERTIGLVTSTPVLTDLAKALAYPFARRTLLVNNVADPGRWSADLDRLVAEGAVDRWLSVADELPAALATTGLRPRDIRHRRHWTDFGLVTVALPGPPYVCYCDPEIEFTVPGDWIGPAIELMQRDRSVAVANPRWAHGPPPEERADERVGEFLVGYGFTDQIFLLDRREFAAPIYRSRVPVSLRSPASLRYPGAADSFVFEMRVDAYMRTRRRRRATHTTVTYAHARPDGSSYRPAGLGAGLGRLRNLVVLKLLVELHRRSPRLRLHGLLGERS
ncbi:MAG TPA: hypothetical protein VKR22_15285 [Acidimicrobiales bacterium]|nr:hypothetical protein [Acidimicrobiales bacterium]